MNLLCAGREPNEKEINAMRYAKAVILPQGASWPLYAAARKHCAYIFPNYDARFAFSGKIGQARLFWQTSAPFPATECFASIAEYQQRDTVSGLSSFKFPLVFKFNWGGQGDTVFLAHNTKELERLLEKAETYQRTGQYGFLLQEFIPCGNKSLRVVIIYRELIAYWRIHSGTGIEAFKANLSTGARHEAHADPQRTQAAIAAARAFCQQTDINLAGFDFIFAENEQTIKPLFLEINYYFGRRGLGGSEAYYALLTAQIQRWLDDLPV